MKFTYSFFLLSTFFLIISCKTNSEEKEQEIAIKKFGSKDSGGVLGEILGPLLNKKKEKKKKK